MRWRLVLRFARNLYRRYGAEAAVGVASRVFALDPYAQAALNTAIAVTNMPGRNFPGTGGYKKRKATGEAERDSGGFYTGQLVTRRYKLGKHVSDDACLQKLDRRDAQCSYERFGRCCPFNDAEYSFPLNYTITGFGGAAPIINFPMYAVDLTTRKNLTNDINTVGTMTRMIANDATDAVGFTHYYGTGNGGGVAKNVITDPAKAERLSFEIIKNNSNSINRGGAAQVLQWSDVKLQFRAPTSRTGYVKVSLVQLNDRLLVPNPVQASSVTRDAAYEQLVKPLLYNAIATSVKPLTKLTGFKVLRTWVKNFSPDSKDNNDTNGQSIRMDLFLNHNRYCQFRRQYGDDYDDVSKVADNTVEGQEDEITGDRMNHIGDPKARLYLFITGTNYDAAVTSTTSDLPAVQLDKHITFDMEIRHKYIFRNTTSVTL